MITILKGIFVSDSNNVLNVNEDTRVFVINCFMALLGIFYPGVPEAYLRIIATICETSMRSDLSVDDKNTINIELIFNLSKITDTLSNFNKIRLSLKDYSGVILKLIQNNQSISFTPADVLEEYNKTLG